MTADSDDELIKRTLRGEAAAFALLMRRYEDQLYQTVYQLVGNAQAAEDIVQETFLTAYQSLDRYSGECQVFAWLYRIAKHTADNLKL